jgi:DNA-binding LacI/PurR family transcriptional regulator
VIDGIRRQMHTHGFDVRIETSDPRYPALPATLPVCSGVIVLTTALENTQLSALHRAGKPITLVSHTVPGLPIPAVMPANAEGIERLMDYLVIDCGCKQFVFIQGDMQQLDGQQRDEAFRLSLIRHDLSLLPTHILAGEFIPSVAAAALRTFLQTHMPFDAVIAADYLMACAALEVLRAQGRRVPYEISVAGFGDGPEAEAVGLTTVAADVVELGRRAARQLLAQMNGLPIQGVTWLNTDIIKRHTCCEDL